MDYGSLLEKSDFSAVVFQKYLLPTGQISTDTIFSSDTFKGDIAFIKDKIFVYMIKPFLEICDCAVRVENFANLHINFVFILKEEVIPKIKDEYEMHKNAMLNISGLDPEVLRSYRREIHESNVEKCKQFLRSGYILTSNEDFAADIANTAKITVPFSSHKVTLDLFNIARILAPSWISYMESIVDEAKVAIQEDNRKHNHIYECVVKSINDGQLYWDSSANTFPRYPEFIERIIGDVKDRFNVASDQSAVRKVLSDMGKIFAFQAEKEETDNELRATMESSHFTLRRDGMNISILENGDPIQLLTPRKTNFLQKQIKTLLLPPHKVITDQAYQTDYANANIKIIYMDKVNEVFAMAIHSQRYKNLYILQELFRYPDFREQQILFEPVTHSMMESIEQFIVHKAVLTFVKEHQAKQSWFSRIINSFISLWNERQISDSITEQESKIGYISNNILKMGQAKTKNIGASPSGKKAAEYSPVQSVINIIKENLQTSEIRKILAKGASPDVQVSEILNLYDDIGPTSKAVINKSERAQNELLARVRELVLKK